MVSEFVRIENIAVVLSALLYKSFHELNEGSDKDRLERLETLCLTLIDTSKTLDKELGERISVLFHNTVVAIYHNQKPFTNEAVPSWIKQMLIRSGNQNESTVIEELVQNTYIVAIRNRIQCIFNTPVFLSDGKRVAKVSATPISKLCRDDIIDPLFYVLPILEKDIETPIFESPVEYILESEKIEYERYESMIGSLAELDLFAHIDGLLEVALKEMEEQEDSDSPEELEDDDQEEPEEYNDDQEDEQDESEEDTETEEKNPVSASFGEVYADMFTGVDFDEDDFDETLLGEEFNPYGEILKEETKNITENDMRNIEALANLMKINTGE